MVRSLTTHVLDITQGQPVAHLALELWRLDARSGEKALLKSLYTNAQGRTDEPLLGENELVAGCYEIVFMVGAYFNAHRSTDDSLPFLTEVPVRFTITNPSTHYHIPLLVSPWAYSTYRGS